MSPRPSLLEPVHLVRINSPIGRIEVTGTVEAVTTLTIERNGRLPWDALPETSTRVLETAAAQLREYFAGKRRVFDLPVAVAGTPFQEAVWSELVSIPFGEVVSYGEIGRVTGRPTAGRAVGGAVGAITRRVGTTGQKAPGEKQRHKKATNHQRSSWIARGHERHGTPRPPANQAAF